MKEKEVFIHIGMPRAGSTFLQEVVFPSLDPASICSQPKEIKDQIIPEFVRKIWVKGYYSDAELEKFVKSCHRVLNTIEQPKVLISQEGLGGFDFQAGRGNLDIILKALKTAFPDAKIIVVFREQLSWVKSLYYLCIKQGYYTAFNNFLYNRKTHWDVNLEELDYAKIYANIKNYFPGSHAIKFELITKNFDSYINLFSDILNEDFGMELSSSPMNKSLSHAQLYYIGKLGSVLGYDRIWSEKYTFIPGHFNTSIRSKGSLLEKLKYILLNSFRIVLLISGKILGRIKPKQELLDRETQKKLQKHFNRMNKDFWNETYHIKDVEHI